MRRQLETVENTHTVQQLPFIIMSEAVPVKEARGKEEKRRERPIEVETVPISATLLMERYQKSPGPDRVKRLEKDRDEK